jgi:type II secretory pathway predicted ATPase ExeA
VIERLQQHYGFSRAPFGRDLAPGMLHRHNGHAEAVARISWCVDQHALGVVTGEVGAGKTVAVHAALSTLDASRHSVIYLPNPAVGARGIHHAIVTALGGVPRFHHATLIPQATEARAVEHAERGRVPILVIDEAHLLAHDQLEGIRMLTNHDLDSRSPFACLLVGQPTLRRKIKLGVHHLTLAGRSDTLFSDDAAALIHQTSRGYPRAVNNLAIQALIAAFAANKAIVDESSARAGVTEVTSE